MDTIISLDLLPSEIAELVQANVWVAILSISVTAYVKSAFGKYMSAAVQDALMPLVALATITVFVHQLDVALILFFMSTGFVKFVHSTQNRASLINIHEDEKTL